MSTRVQWRRGNTAQTATFTGAVGEITVDTDKKVIVVHDGVTAGGFPGSTITFSQYAYDHANAGYTEANSAYSLAQGAFDSANNVAPQIEPAFSRANAAYAQANTGTVLAQASFDAANNVMPQIQPSFNQANASFDKANTAYTSASDAYNWATTANIKANSAFDKANSGYDYANTQIAVLQGVDTTQNTNISAVTSTATAAFGHANAGYDVANSAYTLGFNALPSTGGTVSGSLLITSDLTVNGNVTYTGNVTTITITGNSGQFWGQTGNGFNALYAGVPVGVVELLPNEVAEFTGANNSYIQINFQNENGGTAATTDWIATANNGTDISYYVDMGIAGDGYDNTNPNNSLGTSLMPNDSYLYAQGDAITPTNPGGNLVIGATSTGKVVRFIAGGHDAANVVMTLSPSVVTIAQPLKFSDSTTQSTAAISAASSQVIFNTANTAQTTGSSAFLRANAAFASTNTITDYATTGSFTTSSTAQVSVNSFAVASYRSAKYEVQMTSGTSYHAIELRVLHNGTTVWLTQYGEMYTGASLGSFDATITSGTLNLLFTATNAVTVVKLIRRTIAV